jgi:RimJ/RimL family protein N-acetyltransferase
MDQPTELKTARLRLRQWLPDDREPFADLNADPRVMEFLPAVLSREESDARADQIEAHFAEHGFGLWAVEILGGEKFAGFIGLAHARLDAPFTPCVEIGWRLAAEHWGRGYATEGARAALAFGFQSLALDEILSWTVPANQRSWRVMERIGMIRSPSEDFDHPLLAEDHPLRRHVLYRISAPDFAKSQRAAAASSATAMSTPDGAAFGL